MSGRVERSALSERDVRKSLAYSVVDGSFWALMVGVGETYLPAFAILMDATPLELALLAALPILVGSATQLVGKSIAPRLGGRKPFVVASATLHALSWALVFAVYFLPVHRVAALIGAVIVYWIFGAIHSPAWASWMGDLVPEKRRGSYFGFRNRVLQTTLFVGLVGGGLILRGHEAAGDRAAGFATVFALALLFRLGSSFCLAQQAEPEPHASREKQRGWKHFFLALASRRAGTVTVYLASTNLGVAIATPFFAAYLLEDLRLGYGELMVVLGAAALGKFVFSPVWGRYSDRFGARKVLVLTGILTPVIPLLWLLGSSLPYLVAIQLFSGFAMGGLELCGFTLLLDSIPRRRRERLLAYYGVLNGAGTFTGAMAGAALAWNSEDLSILRALSDASRYFLAFLVSGLVRFLVAALFLPRLRDVRVVDEIRYRDLLLKVVTIRPTHGAAQRPELYEPSRGPGPEPRR